MNDRRTTTKLGAYGYIAPIIEPKAYVLGSQRSAPFNVLLESGDWRPYVPVGEPQIRGSLETNSCTNFGWLNAVETYSRCLFNSDRNFSDRFLAIVSDQAREGNDPQKVAEAIRTIGLIDEYKLPFVDGMTWETYFTPNPMTRVYLDEAKKFRAEFDFKHEYLFTYNTPVSEQQRLILQGLKRSPVPATVYAWVKDGDKYIRPPGVQGNHWIVILHAEPGVGYWIFDSDGRDGTYLKLLSWDYQFDIAKGFLIERQDAKTEEGKLAAFIRILQGTIAALRQAIPLFITPENAIEEANAPLPVPEAPKPPSPVSRIRDWALAVQKEEGWRSGSRSYRNNNPGNLKRSDLVESLGTARVAVLGGYIGEDELGFAQFSSYESGFKALCEFLELAAQNLLIPYKNHRTLLAFTAKYAQPPLDHPYAANVARALGINVTDNISILLKKVGNQSLGSMNIPNWLLSSSGEGIALRWKTAAAAALPVITIAAQLAGHPITPETGSEFIDIVDSVILWVWAGVAIVKHFEAWRERNFRKRVGQGVFRTR